MSNLPPEYQIIKDEIMPAVMERFLGKAGDYGDAWKLLGARGQFSDINRKFWKLYNSIWEGKELKGEQPDECAEDIIGHCLLLLLILRSESTPLRPDFSSPEEDVPPPLPASEGGRLPGSREVVDTILTAARDSSRTGFSLDRIIDAVLALYGRKEHDVT